MSASPLSLLRAAPPPPKVALLPDGLFFVRTVPVSSGAAPGEAAGEIELALEAAAPFPLSQLYHGWYWQPGWTQAVVFAAYRRRFTPEQTAAWGESELVMPAFAALLGAGVEPSTTLLLGSAEGFTAVHWDAAGRPERVIFRPVPPDAGEEERTRRRDELVRDLGGSKVVREVGAPEVQPASSDREFAFRAGEIGCRLPAALAASMDVRDKGELAERRRARGRDVLLWRLTVGLAVTLVLLVAGELALLGGRAWQQVRLRQQAAQRPLVEKIKSSQELTTRINELATRRLRPFEMLGIMVGGGLKPDAVWFTSLSTVPESIHALRVEGSASNDSQVNAYQTALTALPAIERIDVQRFQTVGESTTFIWLVTFKPDAIKP